MSQKQITDYMPGFRKPKEGLDTWIIEEVNRGFRSVRTSDEEYPYELEDCTEVVIRNTRTGEKVIVKDDLGMMEFWETIKGFSFKWKGGKRIQKRTIAKALKKAGYKLRRVKNF
jgi:hypothetical protein